VLIGIINNLRNKLSIKQLPSEASGGCCFINGIGATIVAIESLSTAVGTFFGMLPTP
jgi:hypothetical protein